MRPSLSLIFVPLVCGAVVDEWNHVPERLPAYKVISTPFSESLTFYRSEETVTGDDAVSYVFRTWVQGQPNFISFPSDYQVLAPAGGTRACVSFSFTAIMPPSVKSEWGTDNIGVVVVISSGTLEGGVDATGKPAIIVTSSSPTSPFVRLVVVKKDDARCSEQGLASPIEIDRYTRHIFDTFSPFPVGGVANNAGGKPATADPSEGKYGHLCGAVFGKELLMGIGDGTGAPPSANPSNAPPGNPNAVPASAAAAAALQFEREDHIVLAFNGSVSAASIWSLTFAPLNSFGCEAWTTDATSHAAEGFVVYNLSDSGDPGRTPTTLQGTTQTLYDAASGMVPTTFHALQNPTAAHGSQKRRFPSFQRGGKVRYPAVQGVATRPLPKSLVDACFPSSTAAAGATLNAAAGGVGETVEIVPPSPMTLVAIPNPFVYSVPPPAAVAVTAVMYKTTPVTLGVTGPRIQTEHVVACSSIGVASGTVDAGKCTLSAYSPDLWKKYGKIINYKSGNFYAESCHLNVEAFESWSTKLQFGGKLTLGLLAMVLGVMVVVVPIVLMVVSTLQLRRKAAQHRQHLLSRTDAASQSFRSLRG